LGILCVAGGCSSDGGDAGSSSVGGGEVFEASGGGGSESFVESSSGVGGGEEVEFFDPCPTDTYVFEFEDGTTLVFEIEVFCDPRPYVNDGCPAPIL